MERVVVIEDPGLLAGWPGLRLHVHDERRVLTDLRPRRQPAVSWAPLSPSCVNDAASPMRPIASSTAITAAVALPPGEQSTAPCALSRAPCAGARRRRAPGR